MTLGKRGLRTVHHVAISLVAQLDHDLTAQSVVGSIAPTFRDWFVSSFLPHEKRLPGRKVLIGDNLS